MGKLTWVLDAAHSEVQFSVKHMMVSTVTGTFKKFEGTIESDNDNFDQAKGHLSIDTESVDTRQEVRDTHLKSDDFFGALQYPKISFESTSYKRNNGSSYDLQGKLTIRDTTKTIDLKVTFGGVVKDPYGNQRAGFGVTGKINRKDFNLKWNAMLDSGGAVVSDEVHISANLEFIRPANS
jgi:polyisoprenoid-binding protein YceI